MRSRYDDLIHGKYYPVAGTSTVPHRYQQVAKILRNARGDRSGAILEIGPESLAIAEYLSKELGATKEGFQLVDISKRVVDELSAAGWWARNVDISGEALPIGSRSIDVAIMCEVIEHLIDPDHALEEIRRVLKPDGFLIVTTPNLACWFNRVLLPLGMQPIYTETGTDWVFGRGPLVPVGRPVGHLQVLTLRALLALLAFHGQEIVTVRGLPWEGRTGVGSRFAVIDGPMAHFPSLAAGLLVLSRPDQRAGTTASKDGP